MTIERAAAFELLGPKTLIGPELKPGDPAPDFSLVNGKLETVTMAAYRGKPLLISVVPSLDTSVCAVQTSRFDQEAATLKEQANFITVSADLPFAQARWCGANNATNGEPLSDYMDMNFGSAYGTYVKEVRLESRAVFVIDAAGTIRYVEYVPAAGQEPDYAPALAALKELV